MCAASPCGIPDVGPQLRGTFAGLGTPAVIDYLRRARRHPLELLPIHAFCDDRHLVQRALRNYWGYNTIGFFAPDPRFMPPAS